MTNAWLGNACRFITFSVSCLLILSVCGGAAAATRAKPIPWGGLRDEPQLFSVRGSLSSPDQIVLRMRIGNQDHVLMGNDAQVFLSSRDYIRFDHARNRWVTTDKYKHWKKFSSTWVGTWSVSSHHATGPHRRAPLSIDSTIIVTRDGKVIWDHKLVNCTVSENRLECRGKHTSGGDMSWIFVREGNRIDPEKSRFNGIISGEPASGTYTGAKISQ